MIERYVFIKLKPEHANEQSRAEIRTRSERLALVPGVTGVTVAAPADAAARAAWDLGLVVRFERLDAIESYLEHPEHVTYYRDFLAPRVHVIKVWNFEA